MTSPQQPPYQPPSAPVLGGPAPKRRSARLAAGIVAVVLAAALAVGGVGWWQGWFRTAAAAPKPATGQVFPASFGDGNKRVETSRTAPDSALYADSSGRTFTMGITATSLILADEAKREKPASTRVYGEVHCFNVATNPQLCHRQLTGGWLTFSSSTEWEGERIAAVMGDFYAGMKS